MINYESIKMLKLKDRLGLSNIKEELLHRYKDRIDVGLKGINEENIVYFLSSDIVRQLSIIKQLYVKLKSGDGNYKDVIIIDSYHSATIEGARTTVEKVKKAFLQEKPAKDDKMVINTINGFTYALAHELTIENLLELWKIVVDGVCDNQGQRGDRFRSGMVYIGNAATIVHTPESPDKIENRINDLYKFLEHKGRESLLQAIILHFYFVYIHPFCDGNGRTARLLMSAYLEKNGYIKFVSVPISKAIISDVSGYYNSLKDSEEVYIIDGKKELDITPFIVYMLNVMESAIKEVLLLQNDLSEYEQLLLKKMKKRKGSEISISACCKILGISEADAESVLIGLVGKGYLIKVGNIYKSL